MSGARLQVAVWATIAASLAYDAADEAPVLMVVVVSGALACLASLVLVLAEWTTR